MSDEEEGRSQNQKNTGRQRDYISRARKGEKVERKSAHTKLSDAFEKLKGKHGGYISDNTYLNAWVYGTKSGAARITMQWTDGKGKKGEDVYEFENYFWIRTADVTGKTRSLLRKWTDAVPLKRDTARILRWEEDPDHPQWTRVYVSTDPWYFYVRPQLADRDGRFINWVDIDGKRRRICRHSPTLLVATKFENRGIDTFEADLNPIRRFVADVPVRYPTADGYADMYFDIETDDRPDDLFDKLGEYRILSIAWMDKHGTPGFLYIEEESDEAEREMLRKFERVLRKFDVVFTWNGYNFDYFFLYERMRRLGIKWKWWENAFADLLPVFKRYHFRAGSKNTSMRLDAISRAVLGDDGGKVDLKAVLSENHPGWEEDGSRAGTWSAWYRDIDLLREYNILDVDLLRRVEEFTGYAHLDFTFSAIGNCFANDFHISTKVDGLMVRKGLTDGVHFPTLPIVPLELDKKAFVGGYVHEPTRGIHRSVMAFDFKSLYPSMMTTFNISPDSFVAPEDREKYAPEELISTPAGTTFLLPTKNGDKWDDLGFIPQMFAETLYHRKKYTDLQKTCEVGSDMFLHYYRLAYSYKRLGLSFYGELGNPRSRYFSADVGRSVTESGQFFIKETMKESERLGYSAVYGDTDSIYVVMPLEEADAFVEHMQKMYYEWLPEYNAPPELCTVYLEFEDVYGIVCLVNKKRYFGRMTFHKGEDADHLEIKGLETMRSDGLEMGRSLQTEIMLMIAPSIESGKKMSTSQEVWDHVVATRERTIRGELNTNDITCVAGMTKKPEEYATRPPHVRVVEGLIERGDEWFVGMKVPYIWIRGTYVPRPRYDKDATFAENAARIVEWTEAEAKAKGRRSKPPTPLPVHVGDYDPKVVPYDAEFYWDRKIFPPTLRILEVAFPERDWTSLSTELHGKRERKVARFRRALLDPRRREEAIRKVGEDESLRPSERKDLMEFYLASLSPGGDREVVTP